jgi:hypothetical protein
MPPLHHILLTPRPKRPTAPKCPPERQCLRRPHHVLPLLDMEFMGRGRGRTECTCGEEEAEYGVVLAGGSGVARGVFRGGTGRV